MEGLEKVRGNIEIERRVSEIQNKNRNKKIGRSLLRK